MEQKRTPLEELVFAVAQLEAVMLAEGFALGQSDPQAFRDLSYRARFLRKSGERFPRLDAYLEYYLATRSFSLRIRPEPEEGNGRYGFLVKNHRGSLGDLLRGYFDSAAKAASLPPAR